MNNKDLYSFAEVELPKFLYKTIMSVMKEVLDLGTLVCHNAKEERAFKERTKAAHKKAWKEIATVLLDLGIVTPCICRDDEYCEICGGSRYVLDDATVFSNADTTTIALNMNATGNQDIQAKLEVGLVKALQEYREQLNFGFLPTNIDDRIIGDGQS